ncbi:MAG: M28 family peptidase [bacterium]
MLKKLVLLLVVSTLFGGVAAAADLYEVVVESATDADRLIGAGTDPVLRVQNGYLVLVDADAMDRLRESGLDYHLLATELQRSRLAIDGRLDRANVDRLPMIYESGNMRLFEIDAAELDRMEHPPQVFPIGSRQPRIVYREIYAVDKSLLPQAADMDSLIGLVSQDSLLSYTERLQAFWRRPAGSDSNYVSRDWAAAKFADFGYDSVVIDSFQASISGTPTECQNVIAYKIGTQFPNHHVIVGAHRDAVPASPGADDNGSGSAGVLEIARVLTDVETDMTFIFVLFDAEENGLYGAYHYVDEAGARGDSIVYMLNMDMIGHYENTDSVTLYHGSELSYTELWRDLADSLVNIKGVLSGSSGGSDHYPFAQDGYTVTFAIEWIFSSVYHTYQDSTTYMDFAYMTKLVKASLATAYTVSATAGPRPSLAFQYPGGVPDMLSPGIPTTFDVVVTGAWGGSPVGGSGQLHYAIDGGSYTTVSMTEVYSNNYQATLPAETCGTHFAFFVSVDEATEGTVYDPADTSRPYAALVATSFMTVFEDDFETDKGWTVSGDAIDGQWDRGVPAGGGDRGDPPTDYDGSGQCYLTDNLYGNSDVDGGTTNLQSPAFDLSTGDGQVHYARWYSNHFGAAPFADVMRVYISNNNGSSWTVVDSAGPTEQATGDWYEHTFFAGDFVTPTSQMRLLFEVSDLGSGSVVEAGVDDIWVRVYDCDAYVFYVDTDTIPAWTVDQSYSQQLQSVGGTGTKTWTDKNNDLVGTGLALSSAGLVSGTPNSSGLMSFTALVTDELDSTTEKYFEFTINPAVGISTTTLPNGTEGEVYSQQLAASGGTGTRTWIDKNGDLVGTGLTLGTDGLLAGTPTDTGNISFTAQVADFPGSSDEQLLSLVVEAAWICGDIDGSGVIPDVGDLMYLVTYLFQSGPPPPVLDAANVNADAGVDVGDITALVAYLFQGGAINCP